MAQLDKKKIEAALKSLATAAKSALATLNAMTDGEFTGSEVEKDPLNNLAIIVNALNKGKDLVDASAKYDGLTDEEIVQAQEAERVAEQEALQKTVQAKLAKRQPAPVEPADETLGQEGESDLDPEKPADPPI